MHKNLIALIMSDLDPSGKHIRNDYTNKFEFMVRELGFKKPEGITQIALTKEQVDKYKLPAMKKKYKNTGLVDIWELDALNPRALRDIVEESITEYLDVKQFAVDRKKEEEEIQILVSLLNHIGA